MLSGSSLCSVTCNAACWDTGLCSADRVSVCVCVCVSVCVCVCVCFCVCVQHVLRGITTRAQLIVRYFTVLIPCYALHCPTPGHIPDHNADLKGKPSPSK